MVNDDVSDLVHKIEREIRSVRTVSHTTTSSWKYAHELGIEISYTPPGATGKSTYLLSVFIFVVVVVVVAVVCLYLFNCVLIP